MSRAGGSDRQAQTVVDRGTGIGTGIGLPSPEAPRGVVPRRVPEGCVPLVAFEGSAFDCGRAYGEFVQSRYPGYDTYLAQVPGWLALGPTARRLYDRHAPYVLELFHGLAESMGQRRPMASPPQEPAGGAGCTAFGVSGDVALDAHPLSGQTKDVGYQAAEKFIVLRLRLRDAPTILTVAYPGEVWGFGLWSTGMSCYRTSLYSAADGSGDLTKEQWGLLALAGASVHEAVELAERYGIQGQGSHLLLDQTGAACTVEYNVGGVSTVWARDGIAVHANHPEGERTARHADPTWEVGEQVCSRFRMRRLREILDAERGRLMAPSAMLALADHAGYPQSICRHWVAGKPNSETVAAAVADPVRGQLHVVRGQPCSNWPVSYSI
jgi:isopenicillin-N N-acyltransferase-like protein